MVQVVDKIMSALPYRHLEEEKAKVLLDEERVSKITVRYSITIINTAAIKLLINILFWST